MHAGDWCPYVSNSIIQLLTPVLSFMTAGAAVSSISTYVMSVSVLRCTHAILTVQIKNGNAEIYIAVPQPQISYTSHFVHTTLHKNHCEKCVLLGQK
jgi:hypothetical protein